MAMQEVKAPELWKWHKQGEMLEGILTSIEPENITDQDSGDQKTVRVFFFDVAGGNRCKLRATADLDQKIRPIHIGRKMQIRYEADDTENQRRGENAMRKFKVLVDDKPAPGYEHLQAA